MERGNGRKKDKWNTMTAKNRNWCGEGGGGGGGVGVKASLTQLSASSESSQVSNGKTEWQKINEAQWLITIEMDVGKDKGWVGIEQALHKYLQVHKFQMERSSG